jgi:hypothetical protein
MCRQVHPFFYWYPLLYHQFAEAVAAQLCGEEALFQGADMSTKLKLLGVDVGSIGDAQGKGVQRPPGGGRCIDWAARRPIPRLCWRVLMPGLRRRLQAAVQDDAA